MTVNSLETRLVCIKESVVSIGTKRVHNPNTFQEREKFQFIVKFLKIRVSARPLLAPKWPDIKQIRVLIILDKTNAMALSISKNTDPCEIFQHLAIVQLAH